MNSFDEEYEKWLDEQIDKLSPLEIEIILNEMEKEEDYGKNL